MSPRARATRAHSGAHGLHVVVRAIVLYLASASRMSAQTTLQELWPELDVFWKASSTYRFFALVRVEAVPELGYSEGTLGIHADYLRLPHGFARIGFREIESLTDSSHHEERALAEATFDTRWGWLELLNRTRVELRWRTDRTVRFRDRVRVERAVMMPWNEKLTPFVAEELFYDTGYDGIEENRLQAGAALGVSPHSAVEINYLWQVDWSSHVRHVGAVQIKLQYSY